MVKLILIKKKLFNIKLRMLVGGKKKNVNIAPTLSQYGVNLRDFNLMFEANSFYIKRGFEISCSFTVSHGKIENFKLFEPSSSFYIQNLKLFKVKANLTKYEVLKLIYEISKIKSNRPLMKFLNLKSICKSQLSFLKSYSGYEDISLKKFFYV